MISLAVGLVLLFVISMVFDQLIRTYNRAKPHHPFVSLFVVVGVLYTLIIIYLIDGFYVSALACNQEGWLRWDTTVTAFVVSGTPMIIGNISRWTGR